VLNSRSREQINLFCFIPTIPIFIRPLTKIRHVLKKFVVLPKDVLPVWERLPRVFLVTRIRDFNIADATLIDAIHGAGCFA
jgi:hypothetical protein